MWGVDDPILIREIKTLQERIEGLPPRARKETMRHIAGALFHAWAGWATGEVSPSSWSLMARHYHAVSDHLAWAWDTVYRWAV